MQARPRFLPQLASAQSRGKGSGGAQDAGALRTLDADKEIVGEQRQLLRYLGPIAPLPVRTVERR